MHIRQLNESDIEEYHRLRLWALQESSAVYGSSYAEEVRMSPETIRQRLGLHNPAESFVLGAFSDAGRLVGMIGLYRGVKIKARHKAFIWGMFVAPDYRGQGIGSALLVETIERASRDAGPAPAQPGRGGGQRRGACTLCIARVRPLRRGAGGELGGW